MTTFRQPARLGSSVLRPFLRTAPRTTFQPSYKRFASQDYGSGEGNPAGENPKDQGKSQRSRDLEHPGAPAPDTSSSSGGQKTQQSKEPSSSSTDSGTPNKKQEKEVKGAQPKIHSQDEPGAENDDVKKHNEEMRNRHDKPRVQSEDNEKVDPKFWSGRGGTSQGTN